MGLTNPVQAHGALPVLSLLATNGDAFWNAAATFQRLVLSGHVKLTSDKRGI